MRYNVFGRTGQIVSSLGFGAMNLPGVPFEQARDALNYALDHGITYIDTAATYRNSEEIIGESIGHRRKEFFLATKARERDYEAAKAEIDRSLKRLKTDYVDLLQLHYVNYVQEFKQLMSDHGAYRAALEAKQAGKVRFIGITGHRPELLAKWIERAGRVLIFDEPTQGVDVGAKEEIFALIRAVADDGRAVIVVSSDFSELVGLCTRVVALREGRVTGTVEGAEITEDALVRLAYAAAA